MERNLIIERKKELSLIYQGLDKYNNVIIEGPGGIGKTTLVKLFIESNQSDFDEINYLYGYELELEKGKMKILRNELAHNLNAKKNILWVIDEFESIASLEIKREILTLIREGRKFNQKVILTTRSDSIEEEFKANSFLIQLGGFNHNEAIELIKKNLQYLPVEQSDDLPKLIDFLEGNPLTISLASQYILHNNVSVSEILRLLQREIRFKGLLFDEYGNPINEYHGRQNRIITDIQIVNSELLNKVHQNPNLVYEISPRQFEELVADLLSREGYNVTLTKATRDGGKDLFIAENTFLGNFLFYVECKKYRPEIPVGVKLVRELYGTVMADKATAGILVTSSYFSKDAKEYREKIRNQISLIDYINLNKWINSIKR